MEWIDEIKEQPKALRDYVENMKVDNNWIEKVAAMNYKKVILTGMGSSLFACYIAECYFRRNGIYALSLDSENLMTNAMSLIDEDTLLIAVSQSGESPEVIKLTEMLENKEKLVVVVNYPKSRVYNCGGIVVPVFCGVENYSSSKSFTNTLAAVISLVKVAVHGKDGVKEAAEGILWAAEETERLFAIENLAKECGEFLRDTDCLYCVGGGYGYTSASHIQLIGEESAKIYGSRYTPGQFIHGPIELIKPGFNVVMLNTQKEYYKSCMTVCENVLNYGGKVLMMTDDKSIKERENLKVVYVENKDELYYCMVEIVPPVLAFEYIGTSNNGKPGHLSRVVKRIV